MQIKRLFTALLLMAVFVGAPSDALSQRLYVSGGALLSQDTNLSNLGGTNPSLSGGVLLDLNSVARLRAGLTYQDLTSAEGGVEFHVLGHESDISPYLYAGYGNYIFGDETERGVFPLALGLDYSLSEGVRLKAELAGRWSWTEEINGGVVQPELVSSVMPSIGVVYRLERIERQVPGEGIMDDESGPMAGAAEEENTFGALDATGSPQEFEIEYTKSELKSGEPEVVQRGESLYDDPGSRPYSSPVTRENIAEFEDHSDMMRLPSGSFIMGYTGEDPLGRQPAGRKQISVSGFYIDRYLVTNEDYRTFLSDLGPGEREQYAPDSTAWEGSAARTTNWSSYFRGSTYSNHPVVAVDWEKANAYCEWRGHRLPSEAEWEYAGRGGYIGELYPWRGTRARTANGQYLANFDPEGQAQEYVFTSPVGAYPPNRWGLFDMAGNVYEWVQDAYTPTYAGHSRLDPVITSSSASDRVVRGGSWNSSVFFISVGVRTPKTQSDSDVETGFRCAGDIGQVESSMRNRDQAAPPPEVNAPGQEAGQGGDTQAPAEEPEFPEPDPQGQPEFPEPENTEEPPNLK
jgi:formylglycine-generating enzyme required for sulfatase activity